MLLRAPKEKIPNFWYNGPIELKFWHLLLIMRYYQNMVERVPWEQFWTQALGLTLSAEVRKVQKQKGHHIWGNFSLLWNLRNFGSLASVFPWNWPYFNTKSDQVNLILLYSWGKLKLPQIRCLFVFELFGPLQTELGPSLGSKSTPMGLAQPYFGNTSLWVSDAKISAQ